MDANENNSSFKGVNSHIEKFFDSKLIVKNSVKEDVKSIVEDMNEIEISAHIVKQKSFLDEVKFLFPPVDFNFQGKKVLFSISLQLYVIYFLVTLRESSYSYTYNATRTNGFSKLGRRYGL